MLFLYRETKFAAYQRHTRQQVAIFNKNKTSMERIMDTQRSSIGKSFSFLRCNTIRLIFFTLAPVVVCMPVHADLRNVSGINEVEYNIANAIHKV